MVEEPKATWTEADVNALIGQSESIRREFKSGLMFNQGNDKWVEALSKEVSALANTEGGDLILGIDEDKTSNPRSAKRIDGVSAQLGTERLQQLIEGNVSPYLPGLRLHRVKLTSASDRVVFVVHIPQGSTAYQAKDGRYYGRSEFEVKFLHDHDIRLRMSKGKVGRAVVDLRLRGIERGETQKDEVRTKYPEVIEALANDPADALNRFPDAMFDVMNSHFAPDQIDFCLVLRNDGELTIRDPVVEIQERRSSRVNDGWHIPGAPLPPRLGMPGEVVYPGDERAIAGSERKMRCKREVKLDRGDYEVRWKVFLDNSPPSEGQIDLGTYLQKARE
jgi:hypothetical protein